VPKPDLEDLLRQTLKDDLPHEAEARMNWQFLSFKHKTFSRTEGFPAPDV
jgi:hypothetical protein